MPFREGAQYKRSHRAEQLSFQYVVISYQSNFSLTHVLRISVDIIVLVKSTKYLP